MAEFISELWAFMKAEEVPAIADHPLPRLSGDARRTDGGLRRSTLHLHIVLDSQGSL